MRVLASLFVIFVFLLFVGCTSRFMRQDGAPSYHVDISKIPNAKPRPLPRSTYGNPAYYNVFGKRYHVLNSAKGYNKRGIASWYGTKFHGQLTSSREPYNMLAMTGASPELPIPCFVRVTNLENGRSIIVKINDRGPFAPNRIIDLSYVAAKKLGYANKGTALVDVQTINSGSPHDHTPVMMAYHTHSKHPKLYLQLGAFRELANAENLKFRVKSVVQKPVVILKSIYNHLPMYRVQIGPLVGVGESDHLHDKLKRLGFGNPMTTIGT